MGEVRDRRSSWRRTMGSYQTLLYPGQFDIPEVQPSVGVYDRPLPWCGCGVGWCCFLMGFVLPLFWYYGAFLFLGAPSHNDPRERPGLASCAIAAMVNTAALGLALVALSVQHHGFFQSSSSPAPPVSDFWDTSSAYSTCSSWTGGSKTITLTICLLTSLLTKLFS